MKFTGAVFSALCKLKFKSTTISIFQLTFAPVSDQTAATEKQVREVSGGVGAGSSRFRVSSPDAD